MASIQKRKNKNGTSHWRAIVRIKGHLRRTKGVRPPL